MVDRKPNIVLLILDTLRYAYEVRESENYFEDIPAKGQINREQLELAELLIEKKSAPFDPKAFKDRYQQGLMEIIEAKLKGKRITSAPPASRKANVVNIVDALKQSLTQAEAGESAPKKKRRRTA